MRTARCSIPPDPDIAEQNLVEMICMVPAVSDPSWCFLGYSGSSWRLKTALGNADLLLVPWCNECWQLADAS